MREKDYVGGSWEDIRIHVEDWLRTEGKEMIKQYRSPLSVGDTVRIVGPECQGLVGELKTIDEHNDDEGDFFGIEFDGVEGYIFFREDEIKKVE